MKGNLKSGLDRSLATAGVLLFIASVFWTDEPYLLMLAVAQLIYVPVALQSLVEITTIHRVIYGAAMLSVFLSHVVSSNASQIALAAVYALFAIFVALQGVRRFLRRGFAHWEEISIDAGMIYLSIGGLWYFAYIAGVDTGFGPLMTWLTAIHFHYSAFLLPVSVGLFGRLHHSPAYRWIVFIVLVGPPLVALGIAFWPLLEFVSTLLYALAIWVLIILSLRTRFASLAQAALIRVSYGALGVAIFFSLLYAIDRAFGGWSASIAWMLSSHGALNCLFFGLFGVLGWTFAPPKPNHRGWKFPVSRVRGALKEAGERQSGLVDDLSAFVDTAKLPPSIAHFYEHADQYRLFASVRWSAWIRPFLPFYKWIGRRLQQLNLPISSERTEMTGEIRAVDPSLDGRENPRVWIRKTKNDTVFVAIYSRHETKGRTYMNIALPLPFSTMIGILQLEERNGSLLLSSEGEEDAGIYLAMGKTLFKLPLSERFVIREIGAGSLAALHTMRLFGVPFLRVDYDIERKG